MNDYDNTPINDVYVGEYEDVPEIYKVELDETYCPRTSSYKTCSKCGRRWYKGSTMLRIKTRKWNLYCPQAKYHFTNAEQYEEAIIEYDKMDGITASNSTIQIRVTGWKSRKARLDRAKDRYTDTSITLVKDGVIQISSDHPDYSRVLKQVTEWNEEKVKEQLAEKDKEISKLMEKANALVSEKKQIEKDFEREQDKKNEL